jgi:murein DD-endopeptidase MepM/ murein hydrolase activator NlpD
VWHVLRRARHPVVSAFAALCAAVLLVGSPVAAADDPFQRQRDDPIAIARRQRETLHNRIDRQTDRLTELRADSRRLSGRIDRTKDRLLDVTTTIDQLQEDIARLRVQLGLSEAYRDQFLVQVRAHDWSLRSLSSQADELKADLSDRKRALGARLAESHRVGKVGLWEQILDSPSLMDAVVTREGLQELAERDAQMAASIQRDQLALDAQRRDVRRLRYETDQLRAEAVTRSVGIGEDRQRLRAAEIELQDRKAAIEELRAEQEAQFRELAQTRAQVAELLREQKREAAALSRRIGALLEKERHEGRLPSAFNGKLRWPVVGRISQEFGCTGFVLEPPKGACDHFHGGIDIVAAYGAQIQAPANGVILWVGWQPDVPRRKASFQVVIAHSERLVTYYGHLIGRAPTGIREGVRVRKGQTVGWMGNTGNSTGAHLHWSVIFEDEEVNPRYFL